MAESNSINASTTGIVGNTGTGFTGTPLTQYLVNCGGATSSTISQVASTGTAGQVLTSAGAGALPSFQSPSGGATCAFNVQVSSTLSNVTGDGTTYTVVFGNTNFDVGSDFSSTTFTAPVTGIYLLSTNITTQGNTASHTAESVFIVVAGKNYRVISLSPGKVFETSSGASTVDLSGCVVVQMTALDTATVTVATSGSTKTIGINTGSFFSGALLS